jgi:hypothetical protein
MVGTAAQWLLCSTRKALVVHTEAVMYSRRICSSRFWTVLSNVTYQTAVIARFNDPLLSCR